MALRDDQVRRYARQILLPEVGGVGQEHLLAATVAIDVTPPAPAAAVALAYLAAAGVGTIVLVGDSDGAVDAAEAAASILLGPADIGRARGVAIAERLRALNPDVHVTSARQMPTLQPQPQLRPEPDLASALIAGGAAAAALIATAARGPS